jgi:hypothetical protein
MADGRNEASRLHSLSLNKTIGRITSSRARPQAQGPVDDACTSALALQADGCGAQRHHLAKPNPMESVTDRPTFM